MVKAGDIVKVKVMAVDEARKRIGLSMRMGDQAADQSNRQNNRQGKRGTDQARGRSGQEQANQGRPRQPRQDKPAAGSAFADAFAQARKGRRH